MRWEGKMRWEQAGAEQDPPTPAGPPPCPLQGPSHSRCLAGTPQLPRERGIGELGLVELLGEET
jgi:hypothetical protein